ncbi:MAG TPA: VWA domain-containing protein [Thermoanaerobaculia bacterium]|nr:VWA domain-containing protein [Thermoanaerobaculia bacterium]
MHKKLSLPLIALLLLVAAVAPAQRREFGETTQVVVVEVPVYVTHRGEPVRGLTRDDFEVSIGRKAQPIVDFEVVDLALLQAGVSDRPVTAVPAAARRHFLFLFDLLFSDVTAVSRAREAALDFVRHQMQPSDLAAVVVNAARGANLVLSFTSDRRQVEMALETLGAPQLVEQQRDPLSLTLIPPRETGGEATPSGRTGGQAADAVEEYLRELAGLEEQVQRRQLETRVVGTSRSLADIASLIGNIEGRKYVVYLSEGIPGDLLTGTRGLTQESAESTVARERGEIWNVDSDAGFGSGRVQNSMQDMLEAFRRADAVIHAIDIGGLKAGADMRPRASGTESLLMMAKDTGGQLYENFNDFGLAMDRMQRSTSVTYLLTIRPDDLKLDGKYHRLRVRLVGGPAGAELFHRQGFHAPNPGEVRSAVAQQLDMGQEIMGGEVGGDLYASVLAAPFPRQGGAAYVPVLVEIDGGSLAAGADRSKPVPVEIYAYALTGTGEVAGYFTRTLGLDLEKMGNQLGSGLKYFAHLDLPPGRYQLRVLVRNGQTGASRLATTSLEVPSFGAEAALATPLFPEPQGKWLIIPEAERPDVDYPFMQVQEVQGALQQVPYVPAAEPVVAASGATALELVAYGLPAGELRAEGHAVTAEGQPVPGVSLELGGRYTAAAGLDRLPATLRTQGLRPGLYTLVVTLTHPESGQVQTSSIGFRVG